MPSYPAELDMPPGTIVTFWCRSAEDYGLDEHENCLAPPGRCCCSCHAD